MKQKDFNKLTSVTSMMAIILKSKGIVDLHVEYRDENDDLFMEKMSMDDIRAFVDSVFEYEV